LTAVVLHNLRLVMSLVVLDTPRLVKLSPGNPLVPSHDRSRCKIMDKLCSKFLHSRKEYEDMLSGFLTTRCFDSSKTKKKHFVLKTHHIVIIGIY
jgi:hypothetical protein